jgi:hypothetical protein
MRSGLSLADYARKAVSENPEVIEALMEFERSKRVPKTTYRKRIDVTVDESILRRFKELCRRQGIPVSRAIERLMIVSLRKQP